MLVRRLSAMAAAAMLFFPVIAFAHCDTLNGPVVRDARAALAKGSVMPALRWVRAEDEPVIRAAFERALSVRDKGPEAKELGEMYFFETVVRIHRAGEGAPYTGLKPAGAPVEPGIEAADEAIETGHAGHLASHLATQVANGVRERFARVAAAQANADSSVAAGREYVRAYVEFIHYVERLHEAAAAEGGAHTAEADAHPPSHDAAAAHGR